MSSRTIGTIAILLGVALLVVSALADVIGIGGSSSFGWRQTSGVVVGALGILFGWLVGFRRAAASEDHRPDEHEQD